MRQGQPDDERRELIDERLEKSSRVLIGDGPVRIHNAGLERDVGFSADDEGAQSSQNLPQMHLRKRRAECARRGSGDGGRLAVPRVRP